MLANIDLLSEKFVVGSLKNIVATLIEVFRRSCWAGTCKEVVDAFIEKESVSDSAQF